MGSSANPITSLPAGIPPPPVGFKPTNAGLPAGIPPPPAGFHPVGDTAATPAKESDPKDFGDYLKEYWDQTQTFHPKESAQSLVGAAAHPVAAAQSYSQQNNELAKKASDAFHRGDYTEAARHALHYMINGVPGLGSRLDSAADKMQQGDIGGGLADTAAIATDYVIAPKVGKAALSAATEPGAATRAVQPIKNAANKVVEIAKKPAVVKTAGALTGAAVGHATGIPYAGTAGAYLGKKAGDALSDMLNAPKVEPIPASALERLGMTQGDFEDLPLDGQQQVRDLAGKMTNRSPMPPATPGTVDIGSPSPKGRTMEDLMREDLAAKRAQNAPMPAPMPQVPPAPKQLNAGAIVPEPPTDTSGVIPGWKPQILDREPMPAPDAKPIMPPPGSAEPPASFLDQENTGLLHDKLIANRAAKANRFIEHLGGTQNFPRTQAEWTKVSADMGENVPSLETQAQIEAGLNKRMVAGTEVPKKVETIPAHLQKNPKALKIARQLEESMRAGQ